MVYQSLARAAAFAALLALITTGGSAGAADPELRAELEALRLRVAELESRLERRESGSGSNPGGLRISQPRLDAEVYGFLTSEAVYETSGTGGDRFLNIVPFGGGRRQDDDFFLSVHATRLGLRLRSDALEQPAGLSARGLLEVDFDSPGGWPRIRHAYAELLHPRVDLLFGQTWAVVAQLNPDTVNSDNLFNLGNVYERVPQLRVSRDFEVGAGRLRLEAAALRFFGGFDQGSVDGVPLALQEPPGAGFSIRSTSLPVGQARIAWWPRGDGAHGALSVSSGRLRVEDPDGGRHTVRHLLAAAELALPSWGPFTLSAEAFWGQAPGFNGGVGQTAMVGRDLRVHPIKSWGGFVQLAYRASDTVRCNVLYGIDDPEDSVGGIDVAIARNQTGLANCFWRVLPYLDLALELQGIRTEWQRGDGFDGDDVRLTQAVYLNF